MNLSKRHCISILFLFFITSLFLLSKWTCYYLANADLLVDLEIKNLEVAEDNWVKPTYYPKRNYNKKRNFNNYSKDKKYSNKNNVYANNTSYKYSKQHDYSKKSLKSKDHKEKQFTRDKYNTSKYVKNYAEENLHFEINAADPMTWQKVKGIGPVLSERIVKFKDMLGGFHSINQLKEVYGLDSIVMNTLLTSLNCTQQVQQIEINKANYKVLIRHAYLDKSKVKQILRARKKGVIFYGVENLHKLLFWTPEFCSKIDPYLIYDNPLLANKSHYLIKGESEL